MTCHHGIILADKPAGITSFQSLGIIKKTAGTRKVGHAGTLDRFATGLLIVATGWCTRLLPWFTGLDKRYVATIRFGEETETLDPEGEVIATAEIPEREEVNRAISSFIGSIAQVPPLYSAVHASGERAYKLARAGKEVELKPREVRIDSIEVGTYNPPDIEVDVRCSKGTYIRSLARDIGIAAGSRAHVVTLRRIEIGPFLVDEAEEPGYTIDPAAALARIENLDRVTVSPAIVKKIRNGSVITADDLDNPLISDGEVVVTERSGEIAAIIEAYRGKIRYRLVVPVQENSSN